MIHQKISEKKKIVTSKDKKDWEYFTTRFEGIYDKDRDLIKNNNQFNRSKKLDLHGISLTEANKIVEKFIINSYEDDCKKIVIITGKGLRSKIYHDPYRSKKMNILKYSVPEYIKNNTSLMSIIKEIIPASKKDGGEGAICIFLKKRNL